MKSLIVEKFDFKGLSKIEVFKKIDNIAVSKLIDVINWQEFNYKPHISFKILHDNEKIYIKYYVKETNIRAVEGKRGGRVWEDSCCEFFFSVNEGSYYNLETNCIGIPLLNCKINGEKFEAPENIINLIETYSTLGTEPFDVKVGDFEWQMVVCLPIAAIFKHQINSLSGYNFRANFYKCGDLTQKPHYLSWNPIDCEKPAFHKPEFFGEIYFQ